jgi:hypothetical protein
VISVERRLQDSLGQMQTRHPSLLHQLGSELPFDAVHVRPGPASIRHRVSISLSDHHFGHQALLDQELHRSFQSSQPGEGLKRGECPPMVESSVEGGS